MRSAWSTRCPTSSRRCACAPVPRLGDAALRHAVAAPGPGLRAPRDAVSAELSRERGIDVLVVPATTALYRARAAAVHRGPHLLLPPGQTLDDEELRAQLMLAGYQHVQQVVAPGEYAVRGGLIDLFPMGSPLPYRVDLFDDAARVDPHLRPRHAAQPLPGARSAPAAGPRVPAGRGRARRRSARAGASGSKATRADRASTRTSAAAWPPPASSTTCRCSSTRRRRCSTTSAPRQLDRAARRRRGRDPALLDRDERTPSLPARTIRQRPSCRPTALFLNAEEFFARAKPYARLSCSATARRARPADSRLRTTAGARRRTQRAETRSAALRRFAEDYAGAHPDRGRLRRSARDDRPDCSPNTASPFGDSADFAAFLRERSTASPSASRRCTKASRCATPQVAILSPRPSSTRPARAACAASSASAPRTSRR